MTMYPLTDEKPWMVDNEYMTFKGILQVNTKWYCPREGVGQVYLDAPSRSLSCSRWIDSKPSCKRQTFAELLCSHCQVEAMCVNKEFFFFFFKKKKKKGFFIFRVKWHVSFQRALISYEKRISKGSSHARCWLVKVVSSLIFFLFNLFV